MRSIFIFLSILPGILAGSSYTQCFDQQTRRTISNYLPLAEFKLISLSTCMQNCIFASENGAGGEAICQSVTYNSKTLTCMLFDHNGYKVPAILHPALGIDLFVRKMGNEECRGPPRKANEKNDRNPNFIQLESYQRAQFKSNDITTFRTQDSKNHDYISNSIGDTRHRFIKKPRAMAAQPIREIDGDIKVPTLERMYKSNECQNGYYVVLGTEIQKGEDTEGLVQNLENVEQGDCARLCTQNSGFEGRPFNCKSLNYYPENRKCELYSIQVEPNGPGKFLANPNTIYSEKFCMPSTRKVCQNDEVFILHVQKTIIGKKLGENTADGITPCLAHCLTKDQCKSAVYDDNKKRCSLYSTDLALHGEALMNTIPGNVAIENPCVDLSNSQQTSKQPSEEQEWSACNFKIEGKLYRVRAKGDQLEVRDC